MVDKQISILVADDFGSMRTQIRWLLGQMGFKNVFEARNGKEAMALLEKSKIGLIICDWVMPECNGLDLLRHVRGHEKHRDLPFLMVTGVTEKENVIAAVEAKVSNYIIKPFTPETLEMKIRAIFGSAEPLWEK
ncbi:MAG TPA: response regulator [Deltaproteobacteria bacterium]|jgi:two-component system chemotaxis response regulator CheY|nr:response regulator [Deltaproteobacteria bacterium]